MFYISVHKRMSMSKKKRGESRRPVGQVMLTNEARRIMRNLGNVGLLGDLTVSNIIMIVCIITSMQDSA